jgi:phosphonopyruvate decarboxylase
MNISLKIINHLKRKNINFFTGVPDSVLKGFCYELTKFKKSQHIIAANEGGAISLAAGYYLAKKKLPLVYFQNSGLGNIINPLASMIHREIYGIPMILFIGWRGSENIKDEIQHKVQGKITLSQLELLGIKYTIFNKKKFPQQLNKLISYAYKNNQPAAFIFKKGDLSLGKDVKKNIITNKIKRYDFILDLLEQTKKHKIFATTGFTSRELFQIREKRKITKKNDFYMVGGMGHTSMFALGFSLFSKKKVICLDGDGSFLMHMGASVISANFAKENFKYILLNNSCHESVGCQPTSIDKINLKKYSYSVGFKKYFLLKDKKDIKKILKSFLKLSNPAFLEVRINNFSHENLPRIKDLKTLKKGFLKK